MAQVVQNGMLVEEGSESQQSQSFYDNMMPVVNGTQYYAPADQTPWDQVNPELKSMANVPGGMTTLEDGRYAVRNDIASEWGKKNAASGDFVQKFLNGPGPVMMLGGALGGFGMSELFSGMGNPLSSLSNLFNGGGGGSTLGVEDLFGMEGVNGASELAAGTSGGFDMMGAPQSVVDAMNAQPGMMDMLKKLVSGGGGADSPTGILGLLKSLLGGGGGAGGNGGAGGMGDILKLLTGGGGGGNLLSILAGLYGHSQSKDLGEFAGPGRDAGKLLQSMMNTPFSPKSVGDVTQLPGYQQLLAQREQALGRKMAAQGYNASGNERAAIADLGGAQYNEFYQNESAKVQRENELTERSRSGDMDRLARLSTTGLAAETAAKTMDAGAINRILYGVAGLGQP